MISTASALMLDRGSKWFVANVVLQARSVVSIAPFLDIRLGFDTGVSFGLLRKSFAENPTVLAGLLIAMSLDR